jgi:hypothetical protein
MMQEHRWQARGARAINVWEFVWELNVGSHNRYFEAALTERRILPFEACLNLVPELPFEARLDNRKQSGSFHYGSGM